MQIKQDDITGTKIKTSFLWYLKEKGPASPTAIYSEMNKQCSKFVSQWKSENPEIEDEEYEMDADAVIKAAIGDDDDEE